MRVILIIYQKALVWIFYLEQALGGILKKDLTDTKKSRRISTGMKIKPKITIADHFCEIEDPRIERSKRHQLIDIMTIAICAVICGADSWVAIETYGCAKYEWLKTFLEL